MFVKQKSTFVEIEGLFAYELGTWKMNLFGT